MTGKVYLVGAGPYDDGLLTIKAVKLLKKADVIVKDSLVGEDVKFYFNPKAKVIEAGKRSGHHMMKQEEINEVLVYEGKRNKVVVRLKGGDPFVFARATSEIDALKKAGIEYEVVAGVSSVNGASCSIGLPLTERGLSDSFIVVTSSHMKAEDDFKNFELYAKATSSTLVFLMGVRKIPQICQKLIYEGMAEKTPALVVTKATSPEEECHLSNLRDLSKGKNTFSKPGILFVGNTCKLVQYYSVDSQRILHKKRFVLTTDNPNSKVLVDMLKDKGAKIYIKPAIEKRGEDSKKEIAKFIEDINKYSHICFSSVYGVECFFEALFSIDYDSRNLSGIKVVAIGAKTADKLKDYGIVADLVPGRYNSKSMVDLMEDEGKKVMVVSSKGIESWVDRFLEEKGMSFDKIYTYETKVNWQENYEENKEDIYIFASSFAVKGAMELGAKPTFAFAIGEKTALALNDKNIKYLKSELETFEDLGKKIIEYYEKR